MSDARPDDRLTADELYQVMVQWEKRPASAEQTRIVAKLGAQRDAAILAGDSPSVTPVVDTPAVLPTLPDEQVRQMWRSVQGPRAELTGPLIRFAALVRAGVAAGAARPPQPENAKDDPSRVDGVPEGGHGDLPRPAPDVASASVKNGE